MKTVDVLIIGQGIAGTLLSHSLIEAGLSVMVVDPQAANGHGASQVASGVINPVTGRRVVETWNIAELLAVSAPFYRDISQKLGVAPVAKAVDILAIHSNRQMLEAFNKRCQAGGQYIKAVTDESAFRRYFKIPAGLHTISSALRIDLQTLLSHYRQYLRQTGRLTAAYFDWHALQLPHPGQPAFVYQQEKIALAAKWVIAAGGASGGDNPYFRQLPFRYNKGEALIISVPGLPKEHIYKLRYSMVPWGSDQAADNLFWVGSSYQWEFLDSGPSMDFKASVTAFLDSELLLPYRIVDHMAAVRPASINRRPFAGVHPEVPRLGILNGLGSKGCSLAPYLAVAWKDFIIHGKAFDPEVALDSARH